ncbi:MAG: hypothetical protein R2875_01220 [Desulfobacterales bacterium]
MLNAMNKEMWLRFRRPRRTLKRDDAIRVLVFTGQGRGPFPRARI